MPKLTTQIPAYRKHRSSGQARCRIDGQEFLLGLYGTKASKLAYDQLINQWLAAGRQLPHKQEDSALTITQLCVAYVKHCNQYYRKHDKTTDEVTAVKRAVKVLRELFGSELADEFVCLS